MWAATAVSFIGPQLGIPIAYAIYPCPITLTRARKRVARGHETSHFLMLQISVTEGDVRRVCGWSHHLRLGVGHMGIGGRGGRWRLGDVGEVRDLSPPKVTRPRFTGGHKEIPTASTAVRPRGVRSGGPLLVVPVVALTPHDVAASQVT